jgi:hypothetical protein
VTSVCIDYVPVAGRTTPSVVITARHADGAGTDKVHPPTD